MKDGVIFLNVGMKHGVHLVVSIASLRKHYSGPVAICCEADGPGRLVAEGIALDDSLAPVIVVPDSDLKAGSHGVSYFSKTLVPGLTPFDRSIFLDADTLVVGDISPLWPDERSGEIMLTQFADWVSTGGKMSQRIKSWREVEPKRVARMLEKPWPAINTGVWAWSGKSDRYCEDWLLTTKSRMSFMGDETAAQLIFPDYPHRIMDDRFNASVIFAKAGETLDSRQDVRILHGHGLKFWKRPWGWRKYRESLLECLRENRGNILAVNPPEKCLRVIPPEDREEIERYYRQVVYAGK